MNVRREFESGRLGGARPRIDGALVARAEAWARRERAEAIHRMLVASLVSAARAGLARVRNGVRDVLSAPAKKPCTSDAV